MAVSRGALIVFEGLDRSGKSTQCKLLTEKLLKIGRNAKLIRFPDRSTAIGSIVDKYLTKEIELHDKAAHLLFSANRWELEPAIRSSLTSGITVILDRYVYSGVAYSAAKGVMTTEFCASPEDGLPRPDIVYFIDLNTEDQLKRGLFGNERYEQSEFQKKVADRFSKYREMKYWKVVDGGRDMEVIHDEILSGVLEICKNVDGKPIQVIDKEELCS